MNGLSFDVAHLLAGGLVLVSFMMLYQDRLYALLNIFALHAVVLTLAIAAGTTRLAGVADFFLAEPFAVRVSLALCLVALIIVALAENARIPVDNPATHLELTMVHEAMVLEYSGRHLALIEAASHLKLVLYISLLICLFAPFGMAPASASRARAAPSSATSATTSAAQLNIRPEAKLGTRAAATQVSAKTR